MTQDKEGSLDAPRPVRHNKFDGLYETPEFMIWCYKVLPCAKRTPHSWQKCPFSHQLEKARRRDLRRHYYTSRFCPDARGADGCPRGDNCSMAHNVHEALLHPERFRTQICSAGSYCQRRICWFAHAAEELRHAGDWTDCTPEQQQAAATAAVAAIGQKGGLAAAAIAAAGPVHPISAMGLGGYAAAAGEAAGRTTAFTVPAYAPQQQQQQQDQGQGMLFAGPGSSFVHSSQPLGPMALQPGPHLPGPAHLAPPQQASHTVVGADGRSWLLVSLDGAAGQQGMEQGPLVGPAAAAAPNQVPQAAVAGGPAGMAVQQVSGMQQQQWQVVPQQQVPQQQQQLLGHTGALYTVQAQPQQQQQQAGLPVLLPAQQQQQQAVAIMGPSSQGAVYTHTPCSAPQWQMQQQQQQPVLLQAGSGHSPQQQQPQHVVVSGGPGSLGSIIQLAPAQQQLDMHTHAQLAPGAAAAAASAGSDLAGLGGFSHCLGLEGFIAGLSLPPAPPASTSWALQQPQQGMGPPAAAAGAGAGAARGLCKQSQQGSAAAARAGGPGGVSAVGILSHPPLKQGRVLMGDSGGLFAPATPMVSMQAPGVGEEGACGGGSSSSSCSGGSTVMIGGEQVLLGPPASSAQAVVALGPQPQQQPQQQVLSLGGQLQCINLS